MESIYSYPWHFDRLGLGKEKGLNNESDIFKDTDNLGLETAQNCRNSCAKDDNENDLEVSVEYRLKNIATSEFPGKDNYIKRLEKAIEFFQTKQNSENTTSSNGNEIEELRNAKKLLESDTIPVLIIRDFSTQGVKGGEFEELSPYYRLIKSGGISSNQGSNAGRYGHGQNALIAKSSVKAFTVYSQFEDNNQNKQTLFAGNSVLCTHFDPDSNYKTQHTGFIGRIIDQERWESYRNEDLENLDLPYYRDENGTDIYIWGFSYEKNKWDLYLAMGLIKGFFQAIREKKINFKIYDDNSSNLLHDINHENLDKYFNSLEDEVKTRMDKRSWNSEMQSIKGFLKCTCDENMLPSSSLRKTFFIEVDHIGKIELIIYQDKKDYELTKNWCIMRQPLMKIKNYKKSLGIPFNAICKIMTDEGNEVIKSLEDPTHLKLKRAYCNAEDREKNWRIYLNIVSKVKEQIDSIEPKSNQSEDIPGLSNLIPDGPIDNIDESFSSSSNGVISENEDEGIIPSIKIGKNSGKVSTNNNKVISTTKVRVTVSEGDTSGSEGIKTNKHVNPGPPNPGPGPGPEEGKYKEDPSGTKKALINNEDIKIRFLRNPKIDNSYLLRIIALKNIQGDINLGMVVNNDNSCIPLPVVEKLEKNKKVNWEKNKIKNIQMQKHDYYDCEISLPESAEFAISTI